MFAAETAGQQHNRQPPPNYAADQDQAHAGHAHAQEGQAAELLTLQHLQKQRVAETATLERYVAIGPGLPYMYSPGLC